MPPMTISSITGTSTWGAEANPVSESENVENPALQKADTEWKMASQAAIFS